MEGFSDPSKSYDDPNYVMWNPVVQTSYFGKVSIRPLKFHKCNQTDINKFYPPSPAYNKTIREAWARNSFYCLDEGQDLPLYGNNAMDYSRLDI